MTSTLQGVMPKDSDVVECVGTLDEANAFIGLARVSSGEELKSLLQKIQDTLFRIGAEISSGKPYMTEDDYSSILKMIRRLESEVDLPKSFVILETNRISASLSVARAVVRRTERRAVRLYRRGKLRIEVVEWLNKLSYLLYLMALKTR